MFDLNQAGVVLFALASVLSLFLVVAKPLGKEFESTALVWIRAFKQIRAEWHKPPTIEEPSQPPQLSEKTDSKHESDSG